MKAETYIKQAQGRGYTIPRNISPGKNGKIDIASIPDSKPLISNLLDSGSLAIVREQNGVESDLLPCIFNLILNCKDKLFSALWKNLSGGKVKSVTFVDFEQNAKTYTEKLKVFGKEYCSEANNFCFYSAKFLRMPQEESVKIFKSVIKEERPRVVLFDCSINIKNNKLLKMAISYCLQKNIAVLVIVKEMGLLRNIEGLAKVINIWNLSGKYIIETVKRAGDEAVPPFSLDIAGELIFKEENPRVLDELTDRKNVQYASGVDSRLQEGSYEL